MNFIRAGNYWINLNTVTQLEDGERYNFAANEYQGAIEPAVHIHFVSGGTGEQSTSLILFGEDREVFLARFERTLNQLAGA